MGCSGGVVCGLGWVGLISSFFGQGEGEGLW